MQEGAWHDSRQFVAIRDYSEQSGLEHTDHTQNYAAGSWQKGRIHLGRSGASEFFFVRLRIDTSFIGCVKEVR